MAGQPTVPDVVPVPVFFIFHPDFLCIPMYSREYRPLYPEATWSNKSVLQRGRRGCQCPLPGLSLRYWRCLPSYVVIVGFIIALSLFLLLLSSFSSSPFGVIVATVAAVVTVILIAPAAIALPAFVVAFAVIATTFLAVDVALVVDCCVLSPRGGTTVSIFSWGRFRHGPCCHSSLCHSSHCRSHCPHHCNYLSWLLWTLWRAPSPLASLLEEDNVPPPPPWLCLSSVVICLLTRVFPPCRCFADDDLVPLCPVTSSLLLDNIAAQRCNISLKSNSTSPFYSLEALGESLQTKEMAEKVNFYWWHNFWETRIWQRFSARPDLAQLKSAFS